MMNEASYKFIPTRLSNFRINAKHLKRYPKHVRTLYNKKASAWGKLKRFSSTASRNNDLELRNRCASSNNGV